MNIMLQLLLIEKSGNIKETKVRNFKIDEIYKKCGFKSNEHFEERACWKVKIDGETHNIKCFARDEGRASSENKYDLPPPIDSALYFGSIILLKVEGKEYVDLSIDLWTKVYEKLFGGFEDLSATAKEDENEIDELKNVPKEMKTKNGYLKDGFVVEDDDDGDADCSDNDSNEDSDEEESWEDDCSELDYENYEFSDEEK